MTFSYNRSDSLTDYPSYRAIPACPPASASPLAVDHYEKLLKDITWTIRRTLDLSTIWQQTAQGIGIALGVSRCIVCPYRAAATSVNVVADYCADAFLNSLVGAELSLQAESDLWSTIASLKVAVVSEGDVWDPSVVIPGMETPEGRSVLVMATYYQEQPNGLIILYPSHSTRPWSEAELTFMGELADQVGTAIAHASLFEESQTLTVELQQMNSRLLRQHEDLAEARRQAEAISRLKSEFLANTSHEIRTPLNGMIGFLKLVLDGIVDDPIEQQEFLLEAYKSALHLLDILNDVLDIAKIEAGKLQIEANPVNLNELLEDVSSKTRGQVQEKSLSFEIQRPPTNDEIILHADYQRLLQVMLNLLGNAIKFTDEGGITVSVEIIRKKITIKDKVFPGFTKVRVADTGIGVSLDKQDKLFQSFSQVDGSRTRQYGGTGLGLAISQKLIEAMGGEVNFYSLGEGLGSTVTFTVPLFQDPLMIHRPPEN